MLRRCLLGLAFLLLLLPLALGRDGGLPGLTGRAVAHTWECDEHYTNTDYSELCAPGNTRCASFCFFAECVKCTDAWHCHWHLHCSTDADGNTSCWSHCHRVRHGISPCLKWDWYLNPKEGNQSRFGTFHSPNVLTALALVLPPGVDDGLGPTQCEDGDGAVEDMDVLPIAAVVPVDSFGPSTPGRWRSGFKTTGPHRLEEGFLLTGPLDSGGCSKLALAAAAEPVRGHLEQLEDLGLNSGHLDRLKARGLKYCSELAVIAGGEGAPSLDAVDLAGGLAVTLRVCGNAGAEVEYRFWPYNGLVPLEIWAPFLPLEGNVTVPRSGLYSFQVRSVDAEGEPSLGSNVVHQLVDPENLNPLDREATIPQLTPQPTLSSGVRAAAPRIVGVAQAADSELKPLEGVSVEVAAGYTGSLEYRWWPHSGFGPTVEHREYSWWPHREESDSTVEYRQYGWSPDSGEVRPEVDYRAWTPVTPVDGVFFISDVLAPVEEVDGELQGLPVLFDFQVRSVDAEWVSSELSEVFILLVWGVP